jgi:hypothetical protein
VVVDLAAVREFARPGCFDRVLLAVATHEIGHIVPVCGVSELADVPQSRTLSLQVAARAWASMPAPGDSDVDSHGPAFLRRLCHLYHRAIAAGWDVSLDATMGGDVWVHPSRYLPLVEREVKLMAGATFAEIEATDPPAGLVDQWQRDVARRAEFYSRFQTTEATENAIACA